MPRSASSHHEPNDSSSKLPESSLIPNVHDATGLNQAAEASKLWDSTRTAIHDAGFDLGRRIGGGSYGEVFEATERSNRRRVAIKVVIDPGHERSMLSFAREVRLLGSDHVPRDVMPVLLTSRNESGIQPFHAMEFIDGRVIHEFARHPRPLKMLERCELIERMLRAAHRMHESNLVHGDIKPDNVLASGERVHVVDFGMSGRNEQLYPSLNSFNGPRGTPGFQTNALARGERRPEVSDDIFSASAVAFYVLTDVLVEKFQKPRPNKDAPIEHDFRQLEATLREKTVPAGVRRILLKGLHQKDKRKANDTSVYATAEQMANELAAWRNAQLRRRQRWTQIGVTAALLLMALLLAWRGWALYWAELNARDLVRLGDLQREVARLPNADEDAVDRHLDQAEQALGRRDAALARDDSPAAREAMAEALAALRQAISVSQGIERARPLRRALGEVLNRMPWIATSTVIASEKRQLDNQYESIAELIDAGNTDEAWRQLAQLHEDLARLAESNALASEAERAERRFMQLRDGVAERLRESDGYRAIDSFSSDAANAWQQGDWKQAQDLYGVAHDKLETWLQDNESSEERVARIAAQTEARLQREEELNRQLKELTATRDGLDSRVRELTEQVATVNAQWLKDRETAQTKFAELKQQLSDSNGSQAAIQQQLTILQQAKSQVEQQLATANKQVDDWKQKAEAAERQADNWKQALASAATIPAGGANATIDPAAAAKRLAEWRERLNAVDANDWRAANEAFIAAGVEYRRLVARRETLRRDYQDSSFTIKAIDSEVAARRRVLADALAKRDEADSRMYQNYERQIALQQREYERLTITVGLKSTASEPRAVASRIQSLQIEQQPYAEGHTRATQSQRAPDVLAMLDQPRFSPLGQLSKPGEIWTSPNGFTMAYVPPGEFMMGSPDNEEDRSSDEHQHKVQITKGFVIGTHEVTQGLYQKVMKTNPSHFTSVPGHDTSRFPVEQVSWNDCIAFCNALSKLEGLPPYYEVSGQTVRVLGGTGYRLPTEAEWEFAARAGTTTPFFWGSSVNGREANVDGTYPYGTSTEGPYLQRTTTVGSYRPNDWGLYDTVGNVWEFCFDQYEDDFYRRSPSRDPVNTPSGGTPRVLRGGSWSYYGSATRVANRIGLTPTFRYQNYGFRISRTP